MNVFKRCVNQNSLTPFGLRPQQHLNLRKPRTNNRPRWRERRGVDLSHLRRVRLERLPSHEAQT
jgi:hypothetical protein